MGNFGKKFIALVVTLLIMFAAVGCADDGKKFARTPEAEYDRISSIDGDGVIFDFSTLNKLQIEQTVYLDADFIREENGGEPTRETTLFQLDLSKRSDPKSYGRATYIEAIFLPNLNDKIMYNTAGPYGYLGYYDYDGRSYPEGYDEYVRDRDVTPDYIYSSVYGNRIKLFDRTKFERMSGGKSGRMFTIEATVKSSEFEAFYEWFESFYPFVYHKDFGGDFKFYRGDEIKSVTFLIKTARTQLSEVQFSMVVPANPDVFGDGARDENGDVKDITVNAKTVFSRTGFTVDWEK